MNPTLFMAWWMSASFLIALIVAIFVSLDGYDSGILVFIALMLALAFVGMFWGDHVNKEWQARNPEQKVAR